MKQTSFKVGDFLVLELATGNLIGLLVKLSEANDAGLVLVMSDEDPNHSSRYSSGKIKRFNFNQKTRKYVY
jgi:hypothetical protein